MDLIVEKSMAFYLEASISTLFKRIKDETAGRPLVAEIGVENIPEYIAKHLFERAPYYRMAHETVIVNNKHIVQIADEILVKLKKAVKF